jgi:plastocyanin
MALPGHAASSTVRQRRAAQTATVTAAGGPYAFLWQWDPAEITISKGDRVRWENPTSAEHHVTAWDGPWKTEEHVASDGTMTLRFKKPGVYRYWCDVSTHADIVYAGDQRICVGMCGVITVE